MSADRPRTIAYDEEKVISRRLELNPIQSLPTSLENYFEIRRTADIINLRGYKKVTVIILVVAFF